jgi:hypothetical protein
MTIVVFIAPKVRLAGILVFRLIKRATNHQGAHVIDKLNKLALYKFMTYELSENLIKSVKEEGATDGDIQWWWGLSYEERKKIMQADYAQRLGTAMYFTDEGLSGEEAMRKLAKTLILYTEFPLNSGYINDSKKFGFSPEDYALPWELGRRIGNYVNTLSADGQKLFKKEIEQFSTVNACLRHTIRNGEI